MSQRWELPFCEACERYFTSADAVVEHVEWHEEIGAMPVRVVFKEAPETEQN
jgi:hypothetical protein